MLTLADEEGLVWDLVDSESFCFFGDTELQLEGEEEDELLESLDKLVEVFLADDKSEP